jgi:hypothetical protein
MEDRLESGEQARLQAAVASPPFRALSGAYPAYTGPGCPTPEPARTIRVTREGTDQQVSVPMCTEAPAAFDAAVLVLRDVIARVDPPLTLASARLLSNP